MKKLAVPVAVLLALAPAGWALEIEPDAVFVRVVDIGAGLCSVARIPGEGQPGADDHAHYVVNDAGTFVDRGRGCFEGVSEVVPEGEEIDPMVLSHSDADHLGAVDEILDAYHVPRILRTRLERSTATWRDADAAIRREHALEGAIDINLRFFEYPPGGTYRFGDAFASFVTGFHTPPEDWDLRNTRERRNAGSMVVRLLFRGSSILFTGDAVGRHIGDPPAIPIDSDVLIAPHHGADNGSSTAFIQALSPEFVIFPPGYYNPVGATSAETLRGRPPS